MRAKCGTLRLRCSLFVVLMAGSLLVAQEKKDEVKPVGALKKSQVRLPNNYSKLGLAEEQEKKIREIRASYDPKIDELNAQLKALKEKELAEVEAVLTPEQLKQLATIKAEAKKKTEAKSAASKVTDKSAVPAPVTPGPAKTTVTEKKP